MASASDGLVCENTPNVKIEENPIKEMSKRLKPDGFSSLKVVVERESLRNGLF